MMLVLRGSMARNTSAVWTMQKTNVKVLKGSVKPNISEERMAPLAALMRSHSAPD